MKNTRIGVVSFEHMHAHSYSIALKKIEGVELVGVSDEDEFRGTRMAAEFDTKYYRNYKDLLDEGLDGVIVCTCNAKHCEVSVEALKRGIHVLVEKPFAMNEKEAKLMLDTAEENNRIIMNAFPLRFNPNIIEAKRIVDSGEIGEILCITGINHGKIPSGWFLDKALSGGGGVMDHTVHLADLIRWFTNSEYTSAYCECGNLLHNKGIEDTGLVMARLESGAFATIDCSWAHHKNYPIWPQVDMEIIGTKGTLDIRAFAQVNHVVDPLGNKIEDIVWNEDGDTGLVSEFVNVCRTGKQPLASGLDGARALEVAIAAYKSSEEHRPVDIIHVDTKYGA